MVKYKAEEKLLNLIKPSGVILFKRNLLNFVQTRQLTQLIKNTVLQTKVYFKMPFVISIDEEGGRVSRLPPPFLERKNLH